MPRMKHWMTVMIHTVLIIGLAGCEDSEERRARYAEKKPDPEPLERTFTPPPPVVQDGGVRNTGPAMVEYKGEDIVQITGMSGKNVLLVFYAPWCKHCASFRSALTEYAEKERDTLISWLLMSTSTPTWPANITSRPFLKPSSMSRE